MSQTNCINVNSDGLYCCVETKLATVLKGIKYLGAF